MSRVRVGINGFGRIGRVLLRAGFEQMDIVGINNLGPIETAAHLLKHDSVHGRYPKEVKAEDKQLIVDGKVIPVSREKDPSQIPWKEWEADVVLECTGAFKKKEDFQKHIDAGAKKVLVSAPAPGAELTLVYGVNMQDYSPSEHNIVSNASCTTNCLAPLAKVLHEEFVIDKSFMTTVHSYTNDQKVLDADHKDLRRARAAALSMIPTSTGAAKAVAKVLPELSGRIDGVAIRVPTPDVSLVDFVFETGKDLSVKAINGAIKKAAEGSLKGVLTYENEPLVSSDFIGNPHSSIVDLMSTMTVGTRMGKVFSWYDNEVGFSQRMVDVACYLHEKGYQ